MAKKPKVVTDTKNLMKRGKIWYIKRMVDGKLLVQSTGETVLKKALNERDRVLNPYNLRDEKERAEAVFARVTNVDQQLAKIEDEKPATAVRHGWKAYLGQHGRPDSGPVTLAQYERWFEAFVRWLETEYPDVTELRRVTQEHADAYAGDLLDRVSATTFNSHVNLLALVWRVLEKAARLSFNPWKAIGRKRFSVHSRRELTIDELRKVCEAAHGEMRLLLALGIYCGLRLGDAACLQWSNVDLARGIISLVPQKTARRSQKRVTLPIHRVLSAMLEEIPAERRKGYVMPDMMARYKSFSAALTKDVAKLFVSCGIETKSSVAGEKRKRADCSFHSLRHTFVSLCAAGGVPQSVVQALVGHGSPAMTAHYTHIGIETAQNAVALLPDVTHAKGLPESANATEAEIDVMQKTLDRMTLSQLQALASKVQKLIGKLKAGGASKAGTGKQVKTCSRKGTDPCPEETAIA